jgi:hypothetical protein
VKEKEDSGLSTARAVGVTAAAELFVAACRNEICRAIPALVDDLFAKLDEALRDLADKSGDEGASAGYLDAVRVFRRYRLEILSRFLENLLDDTSVVGDVWRQPDSTSVSGGRGAPGLASGAEAALGERLAIANLISKAESRYRGELARLRGHLCALSGREDIDSHSDPLGPHYLCGAFCTALRPVQDQQLAIKLILYKLFDKQVMNQLGRVYARCCEPLSGKAGALRLDLFGLENRRLPAEPQETAACAAEAGEARQRFVRALRLGVDSGHWDAGRKISCEVVKKS